MTTRSGLIARHVHEGQDALDIGRPDVVLLDLSEGLSLGHVPKRHGLVADVQQSRVPADGQGPPADDLHPGVLLRVVGGRDGDTAVQLEVADREIDHFGADEPEVEDVGAALRRPADQRRRHRWRRDPHVTPDRDPPGLELLHVRTADRVSAVLVQLGRVDPSNVVRLEDLRIEHGGTLSPEPLRLRPCEGQVYRGPRRPERTRKPTVIRRSA